MSIELYGEEYNGIRRSDGTYLLDIKEGERFKANRRKGMEGIKHDQTKPRLDLIMPETMEALGEVLAYGSKKYGDHNYLKGMAWGRPFAACLRHLWAFWSGQDTDPESGLPHLSHAFANVAFLISFTRRGIGTDTRAKGSLTTPK